MHLFLETTLKLRIRFQTFWPISLMKVPFVSKTMTQKSFAGSLKWVTNRMSSHSRDLEMRILNMVGIVSRPLFAMRRVTSYLIKLLYKTSTLWYLRIRPNHTKCSTSRNAVTNFLKNKSSSRTLSCKTLLKRNTSSSRRAKVREALQELLMMLENRSWKSNSERKVKSKTLSSLLKISRTNHWPE